MIEIVRADAESEQALLGQLAERSAAVNAEIEATARQILDDVRQNGWEAVVAWSKKLDHAEPYELTELDLQAAEARCDPALVETMRAAARNIRDYQAKLLPKSQVWKTERGTLGQLVRGLTRVGIYVPGGIAAYPSSVLMNAVPAQVAGVEEIIMVTPPTAHLNDAVMAAARIAGVNRVIALGGAQAIAALVYGVGFVPRVDKLVGPGNAYVAAAKRLAFGRVDIDMVAGPSEVLVIADESANPAWVAADLLSQAEHDRLAAAILVTTSETLAQAVRAELYSQAARLERREIIEASLDRFGALIVCDTQQRMLEIANGIAPEHLEIVTREPERLLPGIRNAGAIFLGDSSPEPLGDYMAGPSHVLPTSGTARFFSPLSVDSFVKKTSLIQFERGGLAELREDIVRFARAEGLTAHANAVEIRFAGQQDV